MGNEDSQESVDAGRSWRGVEPGVFSPDETADVGKDEGSQVASVFKSIGDSEFTGRVDKVVVSIEK